MGEADVPSIEIRLAPTEAGLGGITQGLHGFLGVRTTRYVYGAHVYRRGWRRDEQVTLLDSPGASTWRFLAGRVWQNPPASVGVNASQIALVMAGYYDTMAPTSWEVGPVVVASGEPPIYTDTLAMANTPEPSAGILPVNDRVVFWTGLGRARVWSGQGFPYGPFSTPPLLGVPSPAVPPTISLEYNWDDDFYYGAQDGPYMCRPDSSANVLWDAPQPGELLRLYHSSLGAPGYVERRVVTSDSGTTFSGKPTDGPHAFRTIQSPVSVTASAGDTVLEFDRWATDIDGKGRRFVGLEMRIAGQDATLRMITDVTDGGTSTYVTLSAALNANATNANFRLIGQRIELDDDIPGASIVYEDADNYFERSTPDAGFPVSWSGADAPGYAYAYYDPVTGHVSNLSPIAYPAVDQAYNVKVSIDRSQNSLVLCANGDTPVSGVQLPTGIQYVGEYNSIEVARFTRILWFRTRRRGGGAILYPLGSLDPTSADWLGSSGNPGAGGITWEDTTTDDTALIVSGRVRAPITTNHPPRVVGSGGAVTAIVPLGMVFWDGRLWLFGDPDRAALRCSCDRAQCGMGRAEEAWPDGNRYPVPSTDGTITHLEVVGETLLVFTTGATYRVVGNHETNYRLVKSSTEMQGLTSREVCEVPLPGGAGGLVACVTRDRRVLLVAPGEAGSDIGDPVTGLLGTKTWGVAFSQRGGSPALLVVAGDASGGRTYRYDLKNQVWTEASPQTSASEQTSLQFVHASPMGFAGDTQPSVFYGAENRLYGTSIGLGRAPVQSIRSWSIPSDGQRKRFSFGGARVVIASSVSLATVTNMYFYVSVNDVLGVTVEHRFLMAEPADHLRRYFGAAEGMDGHVKEFVANAPAGTVNGVPTMARPAGRRLGFRLVPSAGDVVDYRILFLDVRIRDEGGEEP